MCTLSWSATARAYDVYFNRDERDTRGVETPPHIACAEGCAFLAPRDTDHGGTWLLVNDAGLTVCLLNDYGAPWHPAASLAPVSRGQVLLACASATTFARVDACLRRQDLARVRAFHLFGFAPGLSPRLWRWRGDSLEVREAPSCPAAFSSSSFATGEVIAARLATLAKHACDPGRPTPAELHAYHHTYDSGSGAFSVLMRRADAATRSIAHVHVDAGRACMEYERVLWPADPAASPRLELSVSALSLRTGEYSARAEGLTVETTP